MDLMDVVVHVFTAEQRDKYNLDAYYSQAEVFPPLERLALETLEKSFCLDARKELAIQFINPKPTKARTLPSFELVCRINESNDN